MDTQVLIAGAGPTGLFLAASLRRLGVDCVILDRNQGPVMESRALVVWPRTMEMFDIHGTADRFVEAGRHILHGRLSAGPRVLAQLDLTADDTRFPYGLFLPQSDTEHLLIEDLSARGAGVRRATELTGLVQDEGGVTAALSDGSSLRAGWLVGCDGAHSAVRAALGLPFEGVTEPGIFGLADVMIDGDLPLAVMISFSPSGLLAMFPMQGGRVRILAEVSPDKDSPAPTMAEVQAWLDERGPGGLTARDPIWLANFHVNERIVGNFRLGRCFLAGDAAHIHSPAGGQGMNTGLQDAANLAWKLAMVVHGNAADSLLATYSTERHAIGQQVIRNTSRLLRMAVLKSPIWQDVRNEMVRLVTGFEVARTRVARNLMQLDLDYGDSPLNEAGRAPTGPRVGARAQDLTLPDGRLYSALGNGKPLVLSTGAKATAIRLPGWAQHVALPNGHAPYPAGRHIVVRPDGYISAVADTPQSLGAALGRISGV
jgi:2-polyprenyl-6-methoxyphenol hydroxylase-like FAD-dependent oxidoreductase